METAAAAFLPGKLRYSNSELTETVDETLTWSRDRGDTKVTFIGILTVYIIYINLKSQNVNNKRTLF